MSIAIYMNKDSWQGVWDDGLWVIESKGVVRVPFEQRGGQEPRFRKPKVAWTSTRFDSSARCRTKIQFLDELL
jgi:hypothetical protein